MSDLRHSAALCYRGSYINIQLKLNAVCPVLKNKLSCSTLIDWTHTRKRRVNAWLMQSLGISPLCVNPHQFYQASLWSHYQYVILKQMSYTFLAISLKIENEKNITVCWQLKMFNVSKNFHLLLSRIKHPYISCHLYLEFWYNPSLTVTRWNVVIWLGYEWGIVTSCHPIGIGQD